MVTWAKFVQDVLSHLNRLDSIVESSSLDYVKNAPKQDIKIKECNQQNFFRAYGDNAY